MPLIFHWGGPRHGQVAEVSDAHLGSGVLVYDGPEWIGVYQPFEPPQIRDTPEGEA